MDRACGLTEAAPAEPPANACWCAVSISAFLDLVVAVRFLFESGPLVSWTLRTPILSAADSSSCAASCSCFLARLPSRCRLLSTREGRRFRIIAALG